MRIKYLTEDGINNIKGTFANNYMSHLCDSNPDWLIKTFLSKGWLKETKYDFDDIQFETGCDDYNITDPINLRAIYKSMRKLPPQDASDERIWAGLAFTDMWPFVQYRRYKELHEGTPRDKLNSFFFMRGTRRSCYMHCLSRCWWIAHALYDENREDPYELCDFLAGQAFPSTAILLSSTNLATNPETAKGIAQALYDRHKQGHTERRYSFVNTNKYLNCIAGISIIDSMTRNEVYDLVMDFLKKHPIH